MLDIDDVALTYITIAVIVALIVISLAGFGFKRYTNKRKAEKVLTGYAQCRDVLQKYISGEENAPTTVAHINAIADDTDMDLGTLIKLLSDTVVSTDRDTSFVTEITRVARYLEQKMNSDNETDQLVGLRLASALRFPGYQDAAEHIMMTGETSAVLSGAKYLLTTKNAQPYILLRIWATIRDSPARARLGEMVTSSGEEGLAVLISHVKRQPFPDAILLFRWCAITDEVHQLLADLSTHAVPDVRLAVTQVWLAHLPPPSCYPAVRTLLDDPDTEVLRNGVTIAGKLGTHLPHLMTYLDHPDWRIRFAAAEALGSTREGCTLMCGTVSTTTDLPPLVPPALVTGLWGGVERILREYRTIDNPSPQDAELSPTDDDVVHTLRKFHEGRQLLTLLTQVHPLPTTQDR